MKRPVLWILLLLSLVANAGILAARAIRPPAVARADWRQVLGLKSSAGTQFSRPTTQSQQDASGRATPTSSNTIRAQLWSALQSDDLRTLMAQLRAAGFPPQAIRAIVTAQIDARLSQRADELFGPVGPKPFWKADDFSGFSFYSDPKRSEAFSQLFRDRSRQLREILGDDIDTYHADPTTEQRRRFGNLPPAKIDRVQRIVDDYDEMMAQIRSAGGGVTLPEDREKFRLLEVEKKADLAAVLSPAEQEDYEMRNSNMLWRVKGGMTVMDATEAEYRAVFRAYRSYEEQLNNMRPSEAFAAGAYRDEPSTLQSKLWDEIRTALGEQRYAEYSRAMNNDYQLLVRVTQQADLPTGTAERVFSLRDGVAQESNRLYGDTTLSADQKRMALQSLAQLTRAQILSALGPTVGPTYTQSLRWLTLVERGSAVTFGPENMVTSKKVSDVPASGAAPKP